MNERQKKMYERAKKEFERQGCTLKSMEYVNNSTKLDYICKRGHEHSIRWGDFQYGYGCPICDKERRHAALRFGIERVAEIFDEKGFILESKEYTNANTKLDCICKKMGHKCSISLSSVRLINGCAACSKEDIISGVVSRVVKQLNKFELTLLTPVSDINTRDKIVYECSEGHRHAISPTNIMYFNGCQICNEMVRCEKMFKIVKRSFNDRDWVLVSTEYVNAYSKLDYVCDKGHKHQVSWHDFNKIKKCPTCAWLHRIGSSNPNWKGGISKNPYCPIWNKEFKEIIKNRDGCVCQNPYCKHIDSVLAVHHIDFDTMNCDPSNLITVCSSCNSMANFDREWHIAWYQTLMNKKYGYIYKENR